MKLWRIETQDEAFLLVFHNVMVSTFRFGGDRRFFGVDTADFVWCGGGTRAIRLPVVCDIPVSDITRQMQKYRNELLPKHGLALTGMHCFKPTFSCMWSTVPIQKSL